MRTTRWTPIALLACAAMTASCAGSRPDYAVVPPTLEIPARAAEPCALPVLPEAPTVADLEAVYAERGAALAACDAARGLAVEGWRAERAAVAAWLAWIREPERRWWPF